MKTCRLTLRTMTLLIPLCLLGLIMRTEAQIIGDCSLSTANRPPENSDLSVLCGTEYIELTILICPIYQAQYNESLMVLNNKVNYPECYGTADWSVTPAVLKFKFLLSNSANGVCGLSWKEHSHIGTGSFSDYSDIGVVNVSGLVTSVDKSAGTITYQTQIMYKFSCAYPLQYLLNNTQLGVSGVNLAIKDNNGSFISTLKLKLYWDKDLTNQMIIPVGGLNMKTKIYVAVVAYNLTDRYNVLLDRCFATTTPFPNYNTYYDLFVGCDFDAQTQMVKNGEDQIAFFSFEAFRFVEHSNQTVSIFYLHCLTRLCDKSECSRLLPNCSSLPLRRRREAPNPQANATVSSPAIIVGRNINGESQTFSAPYGPSSLSGYSSPVVAIIVCVVILAILLFAMGGYFAYFMRRIKKMTN